VLNRAKLRYSASAVDDPVGTWAFEKNVRGVMDVRLRKLDSFRLAERRLRVKVSKENCNLSQALIGIARYFKGELQFISGAKRHCQV
jgi:hypothetical protein